MPDKVFYQWGRIAKTVLDSEEEWRDHLKQRINRPDIAALWREIRDTGAHMGLKGVAVRGESPQPYHHEIKQLMDEIRKHT